MTNFHQDLDLEKNHTDPEEKKGSGGGTDMKAFDLKHPPGTSMAR